MNLAQSLKDFADAFNTGDGNFGVVQYREPIAITEPFPLGNALKEYYSRLHLEDNPESGKKMHLTLFSLMEIVGAQHGWRWIRDKLGQEQENPDWKRTWVIIADRNGDAIFVDVESENGAVYGSIQQRNFLIANNLGDFWGAVAECMNVEKNKYNYEVMDDNFNVIKPFLDDVRTIAEKNLGQDYSNGYMRFFFE